MTLSSSSLLRLFPSQEDKKSKSGRSLNDDGRDESGDRRKGMFFSWSRNRSFGKGPKKRELTDFNYSQSPPSSSPLQKGLSFADSSELNVSFLGVFFFFPSCRFFHYQRSP